MRRILLILCTALVLASPAQAWTLIDHFSFIPGPSNTPSSAHSTLGGDLIIVTMGYGSDGVPTLSDSAGNTWVQKRQQFVLDIGMQTGIWYAKNALVSATDVFTTGGSHLPAVHVLVFSGSDLTEPFYDENSATTPTEVWVTSWQPGSANVAASGDLVITTQTFPYYNLDTPRLEAGYTLYYTLLINSTNFEHGVGWKVSTSSSENPVWSWDNGSEVALTIATFKAAGGTTGVKRRLRGLGAE